MQVNHHHPLIKVLGLAWGSLMWAELQLLAFLGQAAAPADACESQGWGAGQVTGTWRICAVLQAFSSQTPELAGEHNSWGRGLARQEALEGQHHGMPAPGYCTHC